MAIMQKLSLTERRRLVDDVNGLVLVLGVLAVLMVALPCPMSAASNAGTAAAKAPAVETAVSGTKR